MGILTVTLGPVGGPWVNKTRGYLQPLVKAHPDGMRIALLLFFLPYLASGTGLDFLVDWLNGLGISYVPPMPRQGTCRDCSKSTLVSAGIQGKHFKFHEFRRDSVSTSHQHSQQDHVVQRKQQQPQQPQRQQRLERHKHVHAAWKGQHAL